MTGSFYFTLILLFLFYFIFLTSDQADVCNINSCGWFS